MLHFNGYFCLKFILFAPNDAICWNDGRVVLGQKDAHMCADLGLLHRELNTLYSKVISLGFQNIFLKGTM